MHKLIEAACRRTAGIAAGVILTGGVAGAVLLTPGTAFAGPPPTTTVSTTTTVTGTPQTNWFGTTLNVQVSVTPAPSATTWPTGTVKVYVGWTGAGCSISLSQEDSSTVGVGNCSINASNLPDGTYTLKAFYGGSTVGSTVFSPSWGQDTVYIKHFAQANLSTYLNCPSKVFTGQRGSCTLSVTNWGSGSAPNVTAQIALPPQLRANYCGYFWSWSFGCTISNNTAYQNLGTLNPGQTKTLTVVFTAKSGWGLWGRHPGHRFTVKVVGSAASNGYWWLFGQRQSYSVAYVTIIPRGFWW